MHVNNEVNEPVELPCGQRSLYAGKKRHISNLPASDTFPVAHA